MMLSSVASASFISVRLAALSTTPNGAPRRSLSTCRLVPSLPRLVGSGPVAVPPRGGRHRRTVGRLRVPADVVRGIIAAQLGGPQPAPHAPPPPLLEASMHRRARAELAGHRLPLAAGPQDVEDAVQHAAERHHRAPAGAGRLLGREQRTAVFPERIGHPPDRRLRGGLIVTCHPGPPLAPEVPQLACRFS